MNITDFEYSSGWLNRFKKRQGFSQYTLGGETAGVNENVVLNGRKKLSALILEYKAEDVYNMDESKLFYLLQPDKTISSGHVKGCKKAKDRVLMDLTKEL